LHKVWAIKIFNIINNLLIEPYIIVTCGAWIRADINFPGENMPSMAGFL
jgi:hypothetical protein